MGLFDTAAQLRSTILIGVKMDIKDAKAAAKELSGAQKKAMDESIAAMERQEKKLDRQIQLWSKWSVAVGVAREAFSQAKDAFETFTKDAQLRGAAANANIEGLRQASRELATDLELLTFAAAAQNTQFKLSQKEMEQVQKFMLVLRAQGNDYAEVQREVTKSIVEGSVEGLKKFGIVMKETSDKAEGHRQILARIAKENENFTGSLDIAGDSTKRAANAMSNAFRDLKVEAGKLVDALRPLLVALARIAQAMVGIANLPSVIANAIAGVGPTSTVGELQEAQESAAFFRTRGIQVPEAIKKKIARLQQTIDMRTRLQKEALEAERRAIQAETGGFDVSGLPEFFRDINLKKPGGGTGAGGISFEEDFGRSELSQLGAVSPVTSGVGGFGFTDEFGRVDQMSIAKQFREFDMTKMVSDMDKVMEQINRATLKGSLAFNTLNTAAQAAFTAMVTGSKSAGEAIRDALGQSILGMGQKALANSLLAVGEAFMSPASAPVHLAAAAKNAAIAVTLGVIGAALLRKGGGGASAGAGGVPNTVGPGAFGSGSQSTTINYFGGFTDDDPPERRASQFKRLLDRARDGGDDTIVVAS